MQINFECKFRSAGEILRSCPIASVNASTTIGKWNDSFKFNLIVITFEFELDDMAELCKLGIE